MQIKKGLRKGLALGIILLFVGTCIIPSTAKPIPVTANTVLHPGNFFGLSSNIIISWDANDTKEPIIPRGELRTVILDVSFWVTWGIFGRLISYLLHGQPIILELLVVDKPEWCTATISQQYLSFTIPQKENIHDIAHTLLSLQVADDAPAFEVFPVTIQATMESACGPLGFFTVMQSTTQVVNITFIVAYKPLIMPHLPEGNIIETPPLVQVELPIGITNLGNGKTIVQNELVDYPSDWNVALPAQVVLDVGEYKEMNLTIIAPYNFSGEEMIRVSFTPHYYYNYSLIGSTINITILTYYHPP